jgi:hypothetical protein
MSGPVSSAAASDAGNDLPAEQLSAQEEAEEQLGEAWQDELEEDLGVCKGNLKLSAGHRN